MHEPLENRYFDWLCAKVAKVEIPTPSLTYYGLLRELQNTEFVWLVPGDDNRGGDGVDLRHEFLTASFIPRDSEWMAIGCSVFEMLVAFSRRCAFQTDITATTWFWTFIENLGLVEYTDAAYLDQVEVAEILYRFVWRTYGRNGQGGICPLRKPTRNQKELDIWYQFCDYLIENQL